MIGTSLSRQADNHHVNGHRRSANPTMASSSFPIEIMPFQALDVPKASTRPTYQTYEFEMPASEIDSEELEELENEADEEEIDEETLQDLLEAGERESLCSFVWRSRRVNADFPAHTYAAAQEFPDERLRDLTKSLQELGVSGWIQEHVIGKPFNVKNDELWRVALDKNTDQDVRYVF